MFRCQKCKKWLKNITTEKLITVDGLAENYDCLAKSLEENGKM